MSKEHWGGSGDGGRGVVVVEMELGYWGCWGCWGVVWWLWCGVVVGGGGGKYIDSYIHREKESVHV